MKQSFTIFIVFIILLTSIVVSFGIGRYEISNADILQAIYYKIFGSGNTQANYDLINNILFEIRAPRILAVILVGAALSVSGAAFQAMFVNPLVSPGILGVLAGASFGAALGIMIGDSWILVQVLAFCFGISSVLIALAVASVYSHGANKTILLVLGGVISSALFSALLSLVKFAADPYNKLPTIVYWLMGSFASTDKNLILTILIPMFIGIVLLSLLGKYLNIISLGDDDAKALGVRVNLIRNLAILLATLISALTVVVAGMIGWVGLIIPHIARFMIGADNRFLLPLCALLGAAFLLIIDSVCRSAMSIEIPVGIATALIGIPIFVVALSKAKKGFV